MSTLDIAAFITARVDEEERDAHLAHGPEWVEAVELVGQPQVPRRFVAVRVPPDPMTMREKAGDRVADVPGRMDREHVVRHDPASVINRAQAIRTLLEIHERGTGSGEPICLQCATGTLDGDRVGEWPCCTLRAVALFWSNHPDYGRTS